MTGSDGFSPRVASPLSFSADPKDTSGSDAPPTIEPLRFVHLLEPQTSGGDLLKASWPSVPHTSAADAALAPAATAAATAAVYPGSHTPSNSPRSSPAHRRPVNVVSLNESNVVVHDSTTGTGPGTPQLYLDAQSDRHNSPALAPRVAAVGGYYHASPRSSQQGGLPQLPDPPVVTRLPSPIPPRLSGVWGCGPADALAGAEPLAPAQLAPLGTAPFFKPAAMEEWERWTVNEERLLKESRRKLDDKRALERAALVGEQTSSAAGSTAARRHVGAPQQQHPPPSRGGFLASRRSGEEMQWCVDLDAPIADDDEAIAYDPRLGLALRARVTPSPKASPRLQGFPPPRAKVWGSSGGGGGGGGSRPVSVGGCNATNQQPAPAGMSLLEASLRASTAQAAAAYGSPARPPRKASIPSAPGSSTHAASITAEAHAPD